MFQNHSRLNINFAWSRTAECVHTGMADGTTRFIVYFAAISEIPFKCYGNGADHSVVVRPAFAMDIL